MSLVDTTFCAIDIETTGLDSKKDEMVSFACVPMAGPRILAGDAYYTLIRPAKYEVASMKYHGISETTLRTAPSFEEVADNILEKTKGVLVGHSVEFDYDFLRRVFRAHGVDYKREVLDIVCVERWLGRKTGRMGEDLTFEGLMARYGFKESHRHNALADAFFAAQIFQVELHNLMDLGIHSWKGLRKVANSCKFAWW